VHHTEALAWLRGSGKLAGASAVTSLPDVSELPALGFDGWRVWFEEAAGLVMSSVEHAAVFFQSDIRHHGVWVDKGQLVGRAAERAGMVLLFHRIVCRHPAGTLTSGRASYAHLLGFARGPLSSSRPRADVIPDGGPVAGRKAMGALACLEACRFVLDQTPSRLVVDPFCGWGTSLAVANALGLDAVGLDLSVRMCRRARRLRFDLAGGSLS
jgi:hypothetical protein